MLTQSGRHDVRRIWGEDGRYGGTHFFLGALSRTWALILKSELYLTDYWAPCCSPDVFTFCNPQVNSGLNTLASFLLVWNKHRPMLGERPTPGGQNMVQGDGSQVRGFPFSW
jgi:hypothetical protein